MRAPEAGGWSARLRPVLPRHVLGRESLGVAGEERRLANVGQAQEEHDHALQAHAAAGVGGAAVAERVQVALDLLKVEAVLGRTLLWGGVRGMGSAVGGKRSHAVTSRERMGVLFFSPYAPPAA